MKMNAKSTLQVGDLVEVKSKAEILATLDKSGCLDGLPFMPEMFEFCGKRFSVTKRAHKTCDTVFPTRGRRMASAVHLDTRCTGEAHGGCQAGCLIFWKEAWLKKVSDGNHLRLETNGHVTTCLGANCKEEDVLESVYDGNNSFKEDRPFVCQATRLPYATTRLEWWDLRQYFEDYSSGNVKMGQILRGAAYSAYYNLSQAGLGLGPAMRWLHDRLQKTWGGTLWPRSTGKIPLGEPTPQQNLDLQPGELVRVKSHEEILKTLTVESKNRGMFWDAEMVPYCGKTYRVLKRVTRIVDEKTGKLTVMKTPSIILDTVVCEARYSGCRMFCPRAIYSYWREIWLERVSEPIALKENPDPALERDLCGVVDSL